VPALLQGPLARGTSIQKEALRLIESTQMGRQRRPHTSPRKWACLKAFRPH